MVEVNFKEHVNSSVPNSRREEVSYIPFLDKFYHIPPFFFFFTDFTNSSLLLYPRPLQLGTGEYLFSVYFLYILTNLKPLKELYATYYKHFLKNSFSMEESYYCLRRICRESFLNDLMRNDQNVNFEHKFPDIYDTNISNPGIWNK